MGEIKKGVLGGFSGKVGNVVGSSWRGIDYIRSLPKPSKKEPTQRQLDQRARFGLVVQFLHPIKFLLNLGFAGKARGKSLTGYNLSVAYALRHAITGTFPAYSLDYSKVLISRGDLQGAWDLTMASAAAGSIDFTWTDNSGSGLASPTDRAVLVVYNPVKDRYIFTTEGAARSAGGQNLPVPADFSGDEVHVFIAFVSEDGKAFSSSIYGGTVTVA